MGSFGKENCSFESKFIGFIHNQYNCWLMMMIIKLNIFQNTRIGNLKLIFKILDLQIVFTEL